MESFENLVHGARSSFGPYIIDQKNFKKIAVYLLGCHIATRRVGEELRVEGWVARAPANSTPSTIFKLEFRKGDETKTLGALVGLRENDATAFSRWMLTGANIWGARQLEAKFGKVSRALEDLVARMAWLRSQLAYVGRMVEETDPEDGHVGKFLIGKENAAGRQLYQYHWPQVAWRECELKLISQLRELETRATHVLQAGVVSPQLYGALEFASMGPAGSHSTQDEVLAARAHVERLQNELQSKCREAEALRSEVEVKHRELEGRDEQVAALKARLEAAELALRGEGVAIRGRLIAEGGGAAETHLPILDKDLTEELADRQMSADGCDAPLLSSRKRPRSSLEVDLRSEPGHQRTAQGQDESRSAQRRLEVLQQELQAKSAEVKALTADVAERDATYGHLVAEHTKVAAKLDERNAAYEQLLGEHERLVEQYQGIKDAAEAAEAFAPQLAALGCALGHALLLAQQV